MEKKKKKINTVAISRMLGSNGIYLEIVNWLNKKEEIMEYVLKVDGGYIKAPFCVRCNNHEESLLFLEKLNETGWCRWYSGNKPADLDYYIGDGLGSPLKNIAYYKVDSDGFLGVERDRIHYGNVFEYRTLFEDPTFKTSSSILNFLNEMEVLE